jgi:hypothetical protein
LQAIRILGIDGKRFLTSCIITFLCCYLFCWRYGPLSLRSHYQCRCPSEENTSAHECPRAKERKCFKPFTGLFSRKLWMCPSYWLSTRHVYVVSNIWSLIFQTWVIIGPRKHIFHLFFCGISAKHNSNVDFLE